jgi:type IV fimbrial biogenesis protein FimT
VEFQRHKDRCMVASEMKVRVSSGFTLIELIVTLSVIGVLLAISAPGMRQLTLNQGAKTAAFDLFSALVYARSEAIKRPGETVTLQPVSASGGQWVSGFYVRDGAGDKLRSWTVASSITVADKNSTPVTSISFGKDGRLTVTPKLEVNLSSSVSGVSPRCIRVDLTGRPYAALGACP